MIDSYGDWGNVDLFMDHVDIWVMKEYGVKDSWTMVASLDEPNKQNWPYYGSTWIFKR